MSSVASMSGKTTTTVQSVEVVPYTSYIGWKALRFIWIGKVKLLFRIYLYDNTKLY